MLQEYGLPTYNSSTDKISKVFNKQELEKKLMEILDKKRTYNQLIKVAYPKEWKLLKDNLEQANDKAGTTSA